MTRLSPVEKTVRYATTVSDLPSAFSFIMERLDEIGEYPEISIAPLWSYDDDDNSERRMEVAVSNMREEE